MTEIEKKINNRKYVKKYKLNNPEKVKKSYIKYYDNNKDKEKRRNLINRLKQKGIVNNDDILVYMYTNDKFKYLLTPEERKRIYNLLWRKNNPNYWNNWYEKNREKEIERCRLNRIKNRPLKEEKVKKDKCIVKKEKVEKKVSKIKNTIPKEKKSKLTYKDKRKLKMEKENRYYYDNNTTFKDYVLNIIEDIKKENG